MSHSRPTWLEIDLDAIRKNYLEIRNVVGPETEVMAVVKADAYGHGVHEVAPMLAAAGVEQFGVALVEEGVELRDLGIRQPVVVLGGVFPGEAEAILEYALQPVVFDLAAARRLDAAARDAGRTIDIHLKIDTGMARLGFRPEHLPEALIRLQDLKSLNLVGCMSHLAVADEPQKSFTAGQFDAFTKTVDMVRVAGFAPRYRHIANSAAIFSRDLAGCNLVRPGISLYGGLTDPAFAGKVAQHPAMRLVSRIAQLKDVPPGEGVSYGHRYVTKRDVRLATVPVGYADGYNRLLTNKGEVLVNGKRAPVVGTVCMDWILVDVTDLPDVRVGDQVVLLGQDGDDCITAQEWADKVGSITYEVFCRMTRRVPRVYQGGS